MQAGPRPPRANSRVARERVTRREISSNCHVSAESPILSRNDRPAARPAAMRRAGVEGSGLAGRCGGRSSGRCVPSSWTAFAVFGFGRVTPDVDVCLLGDPAPSHGVEQVPEIAQGEVGEEDDRTLRHSRHLDFEEVRKRRRGGILEGVAHQPSGERGADACANRSGAWLRRSAVLRPAGPPRRWLPVGGPARRPPRCGEKTLKRVNRVIAELKVRSSPPAAVRHAVEEAQETVRALRGCAGGCRPDHAKRSTRRRRRRRPERRRRRRRSSST